MTETLGFVVSDFGGCDDGGKERGESRPDSVERRTLRPISPLTSEVNQFFSSWRV